MPSVRLHGVSFAFHDAVPLFSDLSLHLPEGWTGLVGDNGSGKTTLLRLVAGTLAPDSGHVQRDPPDLRVALCLQVVEAMDPAVVSFAWAEDSGAARLRKRLRLDAAATERWPTLSPGERKRWQIGAALWTEPDILMLDEPTNHLDAEARGLLLEALGRFRGLGLVVSHDRALLESLTERTLRFHRGEVRLWSGAYGEARREWELQAEQVLEGRQKLQAEQRRLAARLGDARRDRAAAEEMRHGSKRIKGKKDREARSLMAQTRVKWGEAAHARTVELTRRKLEDVAEQVSATRLEKERGRSIFLDYQPAPMSRLFSVDVAELRAGEKQLLHDVHAVIARDSRIRLAGPNGAGKTTLLTALLASSHLPPERVLLVPQEIETDEASRVLEETRALPAHERGRVMSLVAALGTDPERLLRSAQPSPGETRKLLIALGLGRHAWAAVLDEPTNHLDLPSIERLERALAQYPGALLLVTHDDAFAAKLVNETWRLEGGALHRS